MKNLNLSKIIITLLFLIGFGVIQIFAQTNNKNEIAKGVFWAELESGVEVYLFPSGNLKYRLTVISKQDVKITYHTSINSIEAVNKELTPTETLGGIVRRYEFEHNFSKMTIWMALEFSIGGKKIPALTRTFYDNIFEVAPNEQFLKMNKKTKPE